MCLFWLYFVVLLLSGLLASGILPLPRDMNFPLEKHEDWNTKYDMIRIPASDTLKKTSMLKSCFNISDVSEKGKKDFCRKVLLKGTITHNFFLY